MAEVLGTWAGLDRRIGAIRRKLLDKPEMEPEARLKVRARLERVLGRWLRTAVCGLSVRVWLMICVVCWRRSIGVRALAR